MTFLNTDPGGRCPMIEVSVDFDNDPTSASTTWTDITPYLKGYSRSPVRSDEFAQAGVTSARLSLDNTGGRFAPDNAAGAYYGKLKKMRRVRVRAQWAGVTYNRFFGYVNDWPQSWEGNGYQNTVDVPLVDRMTPLSFFDLGGSTFASANSGTAIANTLGTAGFTASDYSVDIGQSTVVAGTATADTMALTRIRDIAASENGICFPDGGGTIRFHSRTHRLTQNSTTMGTIGDAAGEIPYTNPRPMFGDAWTEVAVTANGGTTSRALSTAGTASYYKRTLTFPPGGSYLVSDQNEALNAAQYLLQRYADPATRVQSVTVAGAAATALWPTILTLDTSQRVLFRRRNAAWGSGTVELQQFVEGYGDNVAVGGQWEITFPLSPASSQSYWLLGNATYSLLGSTTRLGY